VASHVSVTAEYAGLLEALLFTMGDPRHDREYNQLIVSFREAVTKSPFLSKDEEEDARRKRREQVAKYHSKQLLSKIDIQIADYQLLKLEADVVRVHVPTTQPLSRY
jgi:hypothetical protein